MPHIILIGTLDTKLQEFLYIYQQLQSLSSLSSSPLRVTLIDCGRSNTQHDLITITQADLLSHHNNPSLSENTDITSLPRGELIKHMIQCSTTCLKSLLQTSVIHGILSAGGSGGTSLVAQVMREAAPLGMPKMIVSTVASGDTGPLVGETDITMMYSVVDIAGSNAMLRSVLENAAGGIMGMSVAYERRLELKKEGGGAERGKRKTRVGITMFGVTTPAVDIMAGYLKEKYEAEVFVFHATGHGGKAMERMVAEGSLDAVVDLTTTEICDYLFGGNMSAGPTRLEAALKAGIPNIISVGATDMVNFGTRSSVPQKYQDRQLLEHNPVVTLMRTTEEECALVGEFIVGKIKGFAKTPEMVEVWLPMGGVSMISTPGQVFAKSKADAALFMAISKDLEDTKVKIVGDRRNINDQSFATDIADSLMRLVATRESR